MTFYKGSIKDRYCQLCGARIKLVMCFTGLYDVDTGVRAKEKLAVCDNVMCVGRIPDDLMSADDE